MSTYRLKNLLAPRSVALVGASPRQGSVGRAILSNIRKAKFTGEFGLVNSRYAEIDGVATVGSLAKLPFVPELVVITAPAKSIAGLVDEAGRRGSRGRAHRQRRARPWSGLDWRTPLNGRRENTECG